MTVVRSLNATLRTYSALLQILSHLSRGPILGRQKLIWNSDTVLYMIGQQEYWTKSEWAGEGREVCIRKQAASVV